MQNFRLITHLDTFDVVARLHKLNPTSWAGVAARGEIGDVRLPVKSILLRSHAKVTLDNWLDDLPVNDSETLTKWPSMQRLLKKARREIMRMPDLRGFLDTGAPMGRVMISGLQPGGAITWHTDNGPYHDRHARFHIALVTNPLCEILSRNEKVHMPVGSLWLFNNRVMHSAINFGTEPRYHVVFELPRIMPDAAEA